LRPIFALKVTLIRELNRKSSGWNPSEKYRAGTHLQFAAHHHVFAGVKSRLEEK